MEKETAQTLKEGQPEAKRIKLSTSMESDEVKVKFKKQKVAMLLIYSGEGYSGMQIQSNGTRTIEQDIHKAFADTKVVSLDNVDDPRKYGFVRACRTDKGVSASGNVVSLKAQMVPDMVTRMNQALPPQIRILGISLPLTSADCIPCLGGFHAQRFCDSRIYEYLMPTYAFSLADPNLYPYSNIAPDLGKDGECKYENFEDVMTTDRIAEMRKFRISRATLDELSEILKLYEGTHNFWNFTTGKYKKLIAREKVF